MLPVVAGLGLAVVGTGGGPSAPPTNAALYIYASTKLGVQWVNGDASAETQIAYSNTKTVFTNYPAEGEPLDHSTVPAGWTSRDLGTQSDQTWWAVRHVKNGQYSDWAVASET